MAATRRITLVIHGTRADDPALQAALLAARGQGHTVHAHVTRATGDATRHAREAEARGDHTVVAVGGDGTVNEVLNGLSGTRAALGILPLGTANDFARQSGIPMDVRHAMDLILNQPPVRMDTAEVNGRRFLNASTGGIGAEATAETPDALKALVGPLAYALTGARKLMRLEHQLVRVATPAWERELELLLFAVGNTRRTGSGMMLTPQAVLDDGLLDVLLVERMPRTEFARLALRLRDGTHVGEDGVHYVRVPWVALAADAPMSVNVDGEPVDATRLEYRARPLDILVHVPNPRDDARADDAGPPSADGGPAPLPEQRTFP